MAGHIRNADSGGAGEDLALKVRKLQPGAHALGIEFQRRRALKGAAEGAIVTCADPAELLVSDRLGQRLVLRISAACSGLALLN